MNFSERMISDGLTLAVEQGNLPVLELLFADHVATKTEVLRLAFLAMDRKHEDILEYLLSRKSVREDMDAVVVLAKHAVIEDRDEFLPGLLDCMDAGTLDMFFDWGVVMLKKPVLLGMLGRVSNHALSEKMRSFSSLLSVGNMGEVHSLLESFSLAKGRMGKGKTLRGCM